MSVWGRIGEDWISRSQENFGRKGQLELWVWKYSALDFPDRTADEGPQCLEHKHSPHSCPLGWPQCPPTLHSGINALQLPVPSWTGFWAETVLNLREKIVHGVDNPASTLSSWHHKGANLLLGRSMKELLLHHKQNFVYSDFSWWVYNLFPVSKVEFHTHGLLYEMKGSVGGIQLLLSHFWIFSPSKFYFLASQFKYY